MDASEIYSKRLNAKEVIFPKQGEFIFPIADGQYIRKRFPQASSTAPYPQELNPWGTTIEESRHMSTAEKWKTRTRSRSEMPVWTVSQRFSHLQWRRLF